MNSSANLDHEQSVNETRTARLNLGCQHHNSIFRKGQRLFIPKGVEINQSGCYFSKLKYEQYLRRNRGAFKAQ